jgi:hypothetical protein
MRVTQRMAETLVVENVPDRLMGWMCLGLGLFGVLVAGAQRTNWLFGIVGTAFVLVGLWMLAVARTITHRFDRPRGLITMDSKSPWRAARRERELRLDRIADVVLQQKQVRGGEAGIRYCVEYVTTQGEHIAWSAYTSSKDDKIECVQAVREFLCITSLPPLPN